MKIIVTTYLFFISMGLIHTSPSDTFQLANKAYFKKDFLEAIQLYESVHKSGYQSFALYYNLGTAYLQVNQVGKARLYLERASLINPKQEDVLYNVQVVREKVEDYYPFPKYPLFGLIESIHSPLGVSFICQMLWLLFMSVLTCIFLYLLKKKTGYRLSAWLLALVLLLFVFLFFIEKMYTRHQGMLGVLIQDQTELFLEPDLKSEKVGNLMLGYKIKVENTVGEFVKVSLGDGASGWIRTNTFTYIVENKKS